MVFCFMTVNGSIVSDNSSMVYCQGKGSRNNLFVCLSITSKI